MTLSKLERIAGFVSGAVALATPLFFRPSYPHTPAERVLGPAKPIIDNPNITPYIGNFPDAFAVSVSSVKKQ